MNPFQRILCPTDFSSFSERALAAAITLAKGGAGEIQVLYVFPLIFPTAGDPAGLLAPVPLDEATRSRVLERLSRLVEPARKAGLRTGVAVVEGDPALQIVDRAAAMKADLIAMGTHGRRGFDRWLLGSVTERVLRTAPTPVLTVSENTQPQGEILANVLVPLELWEEPSPSLSFAINLLRGTAAHLTLLHVVEGATEATIRRGLSADVPSYDSLRMAGARRALHAAMSGHDCAGLRVDEVVVAGKPYQEILRTAEGLQPTLVVMGVHGRNVIDRAFFGSTAAHVVRGLSCPVLTVRPA